LCYIDFKINKGTVSDIQVSNSGEVLAACSWDKTLKLFDISELPKKLPKMIQTL